MIYITIDIQLMLYYYTYFILYYSILYIHKKYNDKYQI